MRRGETLIFTHEGESTDAVVFNVGGQGVTREVAGVAEGDTFTGKISAADSATMPAGHYRWEVRVTDADGDVTIVDGGEFDLLPSIGADGEEAAAPSWAERALAKVEEVLVTMSDNANVNITVEGGASMSFASRVEMMEFRNRLEERVRIERYQRRNPAAIDNPFIAFGHRGRSS